VLTPDLSAERSRGRRSRSAYDDTKVAAVLHEIAGKDHTGVQVVGVPTIFGTVRHVANAADHRLLMHIQAGTMRV
jgi:hypothetical protein